VANSGTLRERINDALPVIAGDAGDGYDMTRELGLPTFSQFEAAVTPLLKRVALNERTMLLEKLYVVTAQKLMKQGGKRGMEYMMSDLRKRRKLLGRTRAHIKKARRSLYAAEATFLPLLPTSFDFKEIISRLNEFETDLAGRERGLAALVHSRFKTKAEKKIPPAEHSAGPVPWTSDDSIEHWFIEALDKCLPVPPKGTRSLFARDEVIRKVLKVSGDAVSVRSIIRNRKRIDTSPMGAKTK
jgi:hypothetical protein